MSHQSRQRLRQLNRLIDGMDHLGTVRLIGGITCHHNAGAPRQRSADRFPGLSPHDNGVTHRGGFEIPQIFGQVPRQTVVLPITPFVAIAQIKEIFMSCFHGSESVRVYTENG